MTLPDPGRAAVYARKATEALLRAGWVAPDFRAVLILREAEELSYDEIAARLGLRKGTVKSRLSRARSAMREHLVAA